MSHINRLFAATLITHTLHIEGDDAIITHITWCGVESEDGDPPGFYMATSVDTCSREHSAFGSNMSEWKRVGWKDVIKLLRAHFPRRVKGQCGVLGTVEDGYSTYHIACTLHGEHFHCVSCGAGEQHTGIFHKLCGACTEKSDVKRREITSAILNYESEFGVKFREIAEWRDEFEGRYDYDTRSTWPREDFHADG